MIRVLPVLLLLVLDSLSLLGLSSFAADGGSDRSALKIIVPPQLNKLYGNNGIRHTQSLFGTPTFGNSKKLVGNIIYVTPGAKTGCDEYSENVPLVLPERPIFLVDRGQCDFVQKVKVAQKLGAVAVIIADNICQCSETNAWDPSKPGRTDEAKKKCDELGHAARKEGRLSFPYLCEQVLPYMADDGLGNEITISSFLISFLDAQPLKDCALSSSGSLEKLISGEQFRCSKDTKIVTSLEWDIQSTSNKVSWELWSSSDSEGVFKKAFAPIVKHLDGYVDFTPRYFLWDGAQWGCTIAQGVCQTQCTDGGYYCNPDPDNKLFNGVEGRDVIAENLRELCVWEQALAAKNPSLWWEYVSLFAKNCHPGKVVSPDLFNLECSKRTQNAIPGLNSALVDECVTKSWSSSNNNRNEKLDKELRDRSMKKILQLPTVIMNGALLRGAVSAGGILQTICASFMKDNAPPICACVERSSSTDVLKCMSSECSANEKWCSATSECIALDKYNANCHSMCRKKTDVFCDSLGQCLSPNLKCPDCPDSRLPYYCLQTSACVSDVTECKPIMIDPDDVNPVPAPSGGVSASGVLAISLMVACIASALACVYWRRQKKILHEEVNQILSTYMPLEEMNSSSVTSTRSSGKGAAGSQFQNDGAGDVEDGINNQQTT